MCFIVLYFHGHAFFCWKLSKSALLCFIFGKICFIFVNKSIRDKLNDIKQEKGFPKLVMCPPSCLIHICHNSFRKGLAQFGQMQKNCLNLYYFFKKSPCRKYDLYNIEEKLGLNELVVLRHVQCQWLSLVPALLRVLTVKGALKKLLLKEMPKKDKNIGKNDKYMAIKKSLVSKQVEIEIEFLISIKPIFDVFMTKFQAEEPMIYLLYSNCEKLLKSVMGRLLKSDEYIKIKGEHLLNVDPDDVKKQLEDGEFLVIQDPDVCKLVKALPKELHQQNILGIKCFYEAIIKYLKKMLPLGDTLLQALTCLNLQEQNSVN